MDEVRFRTPRTALLAVAAFAICVLPLGTSRPWLAVLFLLPVAVGAWVLRSGVDVDADGLTVRAVAGSRRLRWDEIAGLAADERGRLSAVLRGGGAVRLPVLRARHLPVLAEASGGRIPDPATPPAEQPSARRGPDPATRPAEQPPAAQVPDPAARPPSERPPAG